MNIGCQLSSCSITKSVKVYLCRYVISRQSLREKLSSATIWVIRNSICLKSCLNLNEGGASYHSLSLVLTHIWMKGTKDTCGDRSHRISGSIAFEEIEQVQSRWNYDHLPVSSAVCILFLIVPLVLSQVSHQTSECCLARTQRLETRSGNSTWQVASSACNYRCLVTQIWLVNLILNFWLIVAIRFALRLHIHSCCFKYLIVGLIHHIRLVVW